jgi:peptidoglycan/LPS O-acetylase OafA/YrhL
MAILLGEASYSLYLLHLPLWTVVTHVLHEPVTETVHHPLTALPLLAGYLLGVVGVSILTFRVLEQPARRKIRRALS